VANAFIKLNDANMAERATRISREGSRICVVARAKVLQDDTSVVRGTGSARIARASRIDDAVAGATPLQKLELDHSKPNFDAGNTLE
jgi:hypothetical protein